MNSPVRQHWVPKTYLRAFATPETVGDEDPQVWVYDIASDREFCTSVTNITLEKHLYTLGLKQNKPDFVVESTLSRIEGKVKPLLAKMSNGGTLIEGSDERNFFSVFLSTLLMRNRSTVRVHHELRDWALKNLPQDHEGVTFVIERAEHHWSQEFVNWFKNIDDDGMRSLFARSVLTTALPLAGMIEKMQWCLIQSVERVVITSDIPIVVYHPTEEHWGIGTPGVHIHLPISPEYVLLMGRELSIQKDQSHSVPEEGIMCLNYLTLNHAERFLIGAQRFAFIGDLIREFKGESNQ